MSEANDEVWLLFDGDIVARKRKGQGYERELGSFPLSRFEITVQEATQEHDATPLGKFEREMEDKFGIQDMLPERLEEEYRKRVARREIAFDQDGQPIFMLREDDNTRLLRFRQFARKYLFLLSGIAITIASAITAVILVMRQALRKTAKSFKKDEKTGGVVPFTDITPSQGGGQIVPDTLDWVSVNLLVVVGMVLLFLFLLK